MVGIHLLDQDLVPPGGDTAFSWWRAANARKEADGLGRDTGAAVDILRADRRNSPGVSPADDAKLVENDRKRGQRGPSNSEIPRALPG